MFYSNRIGWVDENTPTRSIQACETIEEAKRVFHGNLSNYIGNCINVVCQVIDDEGTIYAQEAWRKKEEEE